MRTWIPLVTSTLIGLLSGCGTASSSLQSLPAASHGGTMVALPGGKGFVELKTEADQTARNARSQERKSQIVAYFYQPDGTTPASPAPTDVAVKVGTHEKAPTVPLALDSPGGAAAANRFASKFGPYPEGFQGQLDARFNGEPVQVTFLFR